jgi:NADH-quinone oxidoreductase subunit G
MPKLIIDHLPIEVPQGTKVIAAAERLGIMIPRFCYHPALGSTGACRMCAVKFVEGPVKGLEMSCMTDAMDGMVVSTSHPEAMEFRRYVIEWLMLNHPLDCPVCDEGGHCLLQDETVSGGHGRRRYLGTKRTYRDQDLGVFIQHEMNRCIHCFRCRNFYQEFAGYRDFGALQIGNRMYFGRYKDGQLESPFAGNIIDLCPTGVLTDKPSRFKGRRWHLERGPSLCLHCSLGCNVTGGAYLREMLRLEGRLNAAVNGYFICDRGRYGFTYTNLEARPRQARVAGQEVEWPEGVKAAAARLSAISRQYGPTAVACWSSSRASLETMAALTAFSRSRGFREPQFFATGPQERKTRAAATRLDGRLAVSMRQLEGADFILALGADPVHEAPMLALALRQAWRQGKSRGEEARERAKIFVVDPRPVSLPFDFQQVAVAPGHLNQALGFILKGAVNAAEEAGLSPPARDFFAALASGFDQDPAAAADLGTLAAVLAASRRPVIVCGTELVRESLPDLAADGVLLLRELGKEAGLFYVLPGPNAFGAALLATPATVAPVGRWPWAAAPEPKPEVPAAPTAEEIVAGIEQEQIKALLLVESDPFYACPDEARLNQALDKLELLLVLDYLPSQAAKRAHVLLPTLTVFERQPATFVNQEGRAQQAQPIHYGGIPISSISPELHPPRTFLNYVPGGDPRPPAEILGQLAQEMGGPVKDLEDLQTWLERQNPVFSRLAALSDHPEGMRLLPDTYNERDFAAVPVLATAAPPGHLELLLVDRVFGTEELSGYAALGDQVAAPPRLTMNSGEAARLQLTPGDRVTLELPGGPLQLELECSEQLAPGVLAVPRHHLLWWHKLPELPFMVAEDLVTKAQG